MSKFDDQYIDLCRRILAHGEKVVNYKKTDARSKTTATAIPDHSAQARSGARTIRLPHQVLQFDLFEEFPILTSKKVSFKSAILEILWIYQEQSNDVRWLKERGIHIWDEWEIDADGNYQGRHWDPAEFAHTIGTAYGWIVKKYQLTENLIETLQQNPGNRRMVMSLWQNEWLKTAALPSCVWNSQWNLIDGKLNILVTSRSSDVPLGLPFNIVQYATLCYLIAHCIGVKPGQFTFITNDAHIYENQIDGIKEQIKRYEEADEGKNLPKAPTLWLNHEVRDFFKFDNSKSLADIKLKDYKHLGAIKMPVTE